MFPYFLVAIADLTHPLSNNRSSVRIIGCLVCILETLHHHINRATRAKLSLQICFVFVKVLSLHQATSKVFLSSNSVTTIRKGYLLRGIFRLFLGVSAHYCCPRSPILLQTFSPTRTKKKSRRFTQARFPEGVVETHKDKAVNASHSL